MNPVNEQAMIDAINTMKKEKNAVILAHYYQDGVIQDLADFTGDSYKLSVIAANTDADMIVFCGVHFMAETAKILSPDKTVLLPAIDAGCPMADMFTAEKLSEYKTNNPERKIVCYVNSTAEVKALSDVCVTSSNAEKIIKHFKDNPIMYVPDKNLGTYLKDKHSLDLDVWPGFCCIHNNLTKALVEDMSKKYPGAELIVHPEAPLEVVKMASFAGSTKGLLEYVQNSDQSTFLIGTEKGIIHQMKKAAPEKAFIPLTEDLLCKNMKKITLKKLYESLKDNKYEINVTKDIAKDAKKALDKMIELSEAS